MLIDAKITEAQFQSLVTDLASLRGWWWHHNSDSRRATAGLPDLILVRRGRCLFVELKTERGRVSAAQSEVLGLLGECEGVESFLWRPRDWASIEKTLR